MKAKIIKSSKIKEKLFKPLKVKELLNTESFPEMSVALIELDGTNRKVRQLESNATYYVIEGNGSFLISDKTYEVEAGDLVFLPRGTIYQDKGKMTLISFNQPRFTPEQVDYLD